MATDFPAEFKELRQTLTSILQVSDLGALKAQIGELSEQAAAPDLWEDGDRAQAVTSKLSHLQAEVDRLETMSQRVDDLEVLVELAECSDDAADAAEGLGRGRA